MFSKYTFFVFLLGSASVGSIKEVVKIYISEIPFEGWVLIFPMLTTSAYLMLQFTGLILGVKINFPLLLSSAKFLFVTTFTSIFMFTLYGNFLSGGLFESFAESLISALVFAVISVILMKYFYRSNVKKILGE